MLTKTEQIAQDISSALSNAGINAHFMRQWFDFRDTILPMVSFFLLEETLMENKGKSYHQELCLKIEIYTKHQPISAIYRFLNTVKQALLSATFNRAINYLGYEINLPDEGSPIISAMMNFKIQYVETIQ